MRVIIMRGVPGAGKSTWLRNNFPEAIVCSADHHFTADGVYRFDATKLPEAHARCMASFIDAIENYDGMPGTVIAVDNTNISAIEIAPYVAVARSFEVEPEIVEIRCPTEDAAGRNAHGVPIASVAKMAERMASEKLPPFWPAAAIVWGST